MRDSTVWLWTQIALKLQTHCVGQVPTHCRVLHLALILVRHVFNEAGILELLDTGATSSVKFLLAPVHFDQSVGVTTPMHGAREWLKVAVTDFPV